MKKLLLLMGLIAIVLSPVLSLAGDKTNNDNELLRKSVFAEPDPTFGPRPTSYPYPFTEIGNARTSPAISTGYYWVDSDEIPNIPSEYKNPDGTSRWDIKNTFVDTLFEPGTWTRILQGPRILPAEHWTDYKKDGHPYFRNNANANNMLVNFFDQSISGDGTLDSTDDAYAGPMPISIAGGFYFNGIRYDSFYVSTNGVIALTNRRYFYDDAGNRIVPTGSMSAYDPMSMDWFVDMTDPLIGCPRCRNYAQNGDGKLGTADPTRDEYGYIHSVLGMDPTKMSATDPTQQTGPSKRLDGIRARGVSFDALNVRLRQALLAFAWGDMQLSQYNPTTRQRDDHGKAYFKRSITNDKLIVYIVNMAPVRTINIFAGYGMNFDAGIDKRPGDKNYVSIDCQIILDGKDSSVTYVFKRVSDIIQAGYQPAYPYGTIRRNTICGVAGWARHVNYPTGVPAPDPLSATNYPPKPGTPEYYYPFASPSLTGEYPQWTVYYSKWQPGSDYPLRFPMTGTRVYFKQWQNTLRSPDVQYYVRDSKDLTIPLDQFTVHKTSAEANNYELLAGEPRIGAIQPVGLVQNLTNDIQGPNGVNFTPQQLNFRVRYKIENQVTQKVIYNRLVPIDKTCLTVGTSLDPAQRQLCNGDPQVRVKLVTSVTKSGTGYDVKAVENNFAGTGLNGVPPYAFVQIYFPPFEPNQFIENHIGRLKSYVVAEPFTPLSESLGDAWPFDDQFSINLFVLNRLAEFNDDGTEFHNVYGVNMPSVWKWVNINAEEVDGENYCENPLPPRGIFYSALDKKTKSNISLKSPAIRMNRVTLQGGEPNPAVLGKHVGNGDEIRSFPINLIGQYKSILAVAIQRTVKLNDWPRGWCDKILVGPEPRIMSQGDPFSTYTNAAAVSAKPDEIEVEFAQPSDDGLNGIVNIDETLWDVHPRRFGAKAVTGVPALTVFGGGGYRIGFLETDKDSSLALEDTGNRKLNALRPNMFDDGIDHEFKKYFVQIPDTFIKWKNEGARNFRFRIHVFAGNDQKCMTCITDDEDDFIVDNVSITVPKEVPDIEVSAVNMNWPYTLAPASQATSIPLSVTLNNNSSLNAPQIAIKLKIFRTNALGVAEKDPIYCRTENISNLNGGKSLSVSMPAWNARKSQSDTIAYYKIQAMVLMSEKDLNSINDTNFTTATLRFGNSFAYDPITATPQSNVGDFVGVGNRGLNFFGSNYTGGAGWPAWDVEQDAAGTKGGDGGSGQFGVRFTVLNTDTLRGYEAFFTSLTQSPDDIQLMIVKDRGGIPGDFNSMVPGTWIVTTRGFGYILGFNQYVNTQFQKPVELAPGTYWVTISQLGNYGLNLGGSASRMGMRTMNTYVAPTGKWGDQGNSFILDKNFRTLNNIGMPVNDNVFAYENNRFSGSWTQMTPPVGNPGYPNSNHWGLNIKDLTTQSMSQGSWIPMVRPWFGPKAFGQEKDVYQWCSDDLPVNLTFFVAETRGAGVDLSWETASEKNNYGFYIEKSSGEYSTSDWKTIGFKEGKGNASGANRYNFFDGDVKPNNTYTYRLRQVDNDGTQSCSTSDAVRVTFGNEGELTLEPNSPNPFNAATTIRFTVPTRESVTLEVVDLYGNVVKTLANSELSANTYSYIWDGSDNSNKLVVNGTYIYRLTAGSKILTGKMTIVR